LSSVMALTPLAVVVGGLDEQPVVPV
jgi:hypothetical protein